MRLTLYTAGLLIPVSAPALAEDEEEGEGMAIFEPLLHCLDLKESVNQLGLEVNHTISSHVRQ